MTTILNFTIYTVLSTQVLDLKHTALNKIIKIDLRSKIVAFHAIFKIVGIGVTPSPHRLESYTSSAAICQVPVT